MSPASHGPFRCNPFSGSAPRLRDQLPFCLDFLVPKFGNEERIQSGQACSVRMLKCLRRITFCTCPISLGLSDEMAGDSVWGMLPILRTTSAKLQSD